MFSHLNVGQGKNKRKTQTWIKIRENEFMGGRKGSQNYAWNSREASSRSALIAMTTYFALRNLVRNILGILDFKLNLKIRVSFSLNQDVL